MTIINGQVANAEDIQALKALQDSTMLIQYINQRLTDNKALSSSLFTVPNVYVDPFRDGSGVGNSAGLFGTIDTGTSDALFVSTYYTNAIESTVQDNTTKVLGAVLLYTFSPLSNLIILRAISSVTVSPGNDFGTFAKFFYTDLTNASTSPIYGVGVKSHTNSNPSKTVIKVEIWGALRNAEPGPGTTVYGGYDYYTYSDKFVQTNAQTVTANPDAHQVYSTSVLTGAATLTYDISFDGGSTWDLDQTLNTYNVTTKTGSSMKVKFNLNGSGNSNTVEMYGYGVNLTFGGLFG